MTILEYLQQKGLIPYADSTDGERAEEASERIIQHVERSWGRIGQGEIETP